MTTFGWIFLVSSVIIVIVSTHKEAYILSAVVELLWVGIGVAALLCNISPDKTYGFFAGAWHGLMFIPNIFRHWAFDSDILFKAINMRSGYGVTYWFFLVLSIFSILSGTGKTIKELTL